MKSYSTRRDVLERGLLLAVGAALGASAGPLTHFLPRPARRPAPASSPPRVAIALSLGVLQRRSRERKSDGSLPQEIIALGGLNRIGGFTVAADGDVIVFGERDLRLPPQHIDALMIALRSAYQTAALYDQPPGCTIDPRHGEADPWAIQDVKVLGMPLNCRMAKRHVDLDYELKLVSAGFRPLEGVHDTFERRFKDAGLCRGRSDDRTEVTNRFWFTSLYPETPRFEVDDKTLLIRKPVGVQVLTERLAKDGSSEKRPAPGDAVAEAFVGDVTKLIASGSRREYQELVADFQIIELGKLLHHQGVPAAKLAYLLEEHRWEPAEVPRYVTGIRRSEQVEAVCGGKITETPGKVLAMTDVSRASSDYRGGVEARVETPADHFAHARPHSFGELEARIAAARPADDALFWDV